VLRCVHGIAMVVCSVTLLLVIHAQYHSVNIYAVGLSANFDEIPPDQLLSMSDCFANSRNHCTSAAPFHISHCRFREFNQSSSFPLSCKFLECIRWPAGRSFTSVIPSHKLLQIPDEFPQHNSFAQQTGRFQHIFTSITP
jgi:hypothetical protein